MSLNVASLLQRNNNPAWNALIGWSFDEAQGHFESGQAAQERGDSNASHFCKMLSSYAQELLHFSHTDAVPSTGLQLLIMAGTRTDIMLLMAVSQLASQPPAKLPGANK